MKFNKKSPDHPGLSIKFLIIQTYLFFLAAFFLAAFLFGAAFFLAAFFFVAILLNLVVSKWINDSKSNNYF